MDVTPCYLDTLARMIERHVPRQDLPDADTRGLFRIYAVLLLAKGQRTDLKDVHNAWVAWMLPRDPYHEALVPFNELAASQTKFDEPFVEAIHAAAQEVADGTRSN